MAIILCPECKGKVSDKADVCPHCGFPISKTKNESENECFIDGTTYNLSDVLYHINNDTQHDYNEDKSGIKKEALYLLVTKYNLDLPDALKLHRQIKNIGKIPHSYHRESNNIPKCPTCSSTNIQKIGTGERMASVIGLGLFSKKINKSWKCKNCGHTW